MHDPNPQELRRTILTHHLARLTWVAFIITFVIARSIALLRTDFHIMVGDTHLHHLNVGIILLAAMGGYLLFRRPGGHELRSAAVLYGVALGLTFDEFGMWLHLGGSYWQRGSFDAVIALLSLFGFLAFMPPLARMRAYHWTTGAMTLLLVVAFYIILFASAKTIGNRYGPWLQDIEETGPQ